MLPIRRATLADLFAYTFVLMIAGKTVVIVQLSQGHGKGALVTLARPPSSTPCMITQ